MADFRVTIDVLNVGPGDVDDLADAIRATWGDEFDASNGEFTVTVSQKSGDKFFTRDPGDDLIQS